MRQKIAAVPADAQAKFQPLQSALDKLATTDFSGAGIAKLPGILAEIVISSANLEGGMQGAITSMQSLLDSSAQTAEGLEGLKTAFTGMGLSFDTTTGIIKDKTGQMVGDLQVMGEGATTSAATAVTAIDTLGPAGTAARTTLAYEMVALTFLIDKFAQEAKQSAIEVSTAFANMGANSTISMNKMASGFLIIIAAFTRIASDSQRMATTVSGSFSNMASNSIAAMNKMASGIIIILSSFTKISSAAQQMNSAVSSAMSSMASKTSSFASTFSSAMSKVSSSASSAQSAVSRLASAINSLKSKSITITVTTVYRTVYAAGGGAFISSAPQRIGPMRVSEFGQKELVTVTPLEGPGRNKIKGLSDIMAGGKEKAEKKAGRMLEREATEPSSAQKEMVMMRETPIIIQVDGREIARVVNKRIFEESDALV